MKQRFDRLIDRLRHSRDSMSSLAKVGLVGAGYVLAVVAGVAAVACEMIARNVLGIPGDSGMAAFGDFLLFLGVSGIGALLPTGVALFFLRPYPTFWRVTSVAAFAFAITALMALTVMAIDIRSLLATVSFLRILVAPLFALAFGLAGCFAPTRNARISLLAAGIIDGMSFACWFGACLLRSL